MEINLESLKEDEKKIIEYINSNEKDNYENIIKENLNDSVMLGLSNIRNNLVYAYDFEPDSTVLEIGAHLGEITGALCEKCAKVISVEPNEARARAILKRYSDKDNLDIVVTEISKIKLEEKFDYITLFGILEYAQEIFNTENPALDMILYCKKMLKPNGKLLIATDNKFALKSYIGEKDECTGITFDSITGYKNSNKQYKLGKKKIENVLKEAGMNHYKFFYPLPDYKLPSLIFTDEYLPSSSKINGYFPYYMDSSSIFYSEVDAYDAIIKEDKKMFPFFANSYFIVVSQNEFKDDIKYVSFNNYRKEKYQLMTKIRENTVEKTSINAKSKKHLEQMMDNIKNLNSKNIKILDEAYEDKVVSKFINLKLASQLVSDNIERPQEIIKILNKYKEKILTISTEYDENEKTIFEKYIPDIDKNILSKFRYLKDGYWDMILKNCFIIDEECVFFDQDWVEENVPVEFLVYRSIVNVEKLRNKIEEYQLYEKMQIKEYIPLFEKLDGKIGAEIMDEKVFSFYQRKHKNPIYDNYILEDKNKKLMSENNKISNQNIELEKKIETELKQNEILNGQIYYLTNENKELKKKLDVIYDSRSWKIVKGISNIKKVIKK